VEEQFEEYRGRLRSMIEPGGEEPIRAELDRLRRVEADTRTRLREIEEELHAIRIRRSPGRVGRETEEAFASLLAGSTVSPPGAFPEPAREEELDGERRVLHRLLEGPLPRMIAAADHALKQTRAFHHRPIVAAAYKAYLEAYAPLFVASAALDSAIEEAIQESGLALPVVFRPRNHRVREWGSIAGHAREVRERYGVSSPALDRLIGREEKAIEEGAQRVAEREAKDRARAEQEERERVARRERGERLLLLET
jgi:hypothetical protein